MYIYSIYMYVHVYKYLHIYLNPKVSTTTLLIITIENYYFIKGYCWEAKAGRS